MPRLVRPVVVRRPAVAVAARPVRRPAVTATAPVVRRFNKGGSVKKPKNK